MVVALRGIDGVSCVVVSFSSLIVLGFMVTEISPPVVVWLTLTFILRVLISAVVVYSSVRGALLDADPSSVGPSPLYSPVWSRNINHSEENNFCAQFPF